MIVPSARAVWASPVTPFMHVLNASALTCVPVFPESVERRWTLRRSSPIMSYPGWPSGGHDSFYCTSLGARNRPSMGPVAWVKLIHQAAIGHRPRTAPARETGLLRRVIDRLPL